jgi:hypothetical protein
MKRIIIEIETESEDSLIIKELGRWLNENFVNKANIKIE